MAIHARKTCARSVCVRHCPCWVVAFMASALALVRAEPEARLRVLAIRTRAARAAAPAARAATVPVAKRPLAARQSAAMRVTGSADRGRALQPTRQVPEAR